MASDILAATYGPIVTGILTGIGVAFREWRNQRSLERKRKEILSRATSEVTFLEAWVRVYSQLGCDLRNGERFRGVERELTRLYEDVRSTVPVDTIEHRRVTLGGVVKKIFFLKSPMGTTSGILLRMAYYPVLVFALAVISAASMTAVHSFTVADFFAGLTVVLILGAGPIGALRIVDYWVVSRSQNKGPRDGRGPEPTRRGPGGVPYDVYDRAGT